MSVAAPSNPLEKHFCIRGSDPLDAADFTNALWVSLHPSREKLIAPVRDELTSCQLFITQAGRRKKKMP